MLNENAKAWVDALRSGKYKQCAGSLTDRGTSFCCLGVACDVLDKENFSAWQFRGDLPQKVCEFLGLRTAMGRFAGTDLAFVNDTGKSFSEIADIIESEPEGLFGQGEK